MEVSISTTFNFDIPFSIMAPMVKSAGFNSISLAGGNYTQSKYLTTGGRDDILGICRKNRLVIDSVHAPLGSDIDVSHPDKDVRKYSVHLFKQTINACTEIGCSILIVHLCSKFPDDEFDSRMIAARESLEDIIPYACNKNIALAVENLIKPNTFQLFEHVLAEQDADNVGVCLDTSHANIAGNLYSILGKYANRIIAVHISDNKGLLDDHMLPFEGVIDWDKFIKHFAEKLYKGNFLLEVEMRESSFKDPEVFLKEAYTRAHILIALLDKYKLS